MKRSKKLYALLGVLAVICGVTFGVSRYEQRKEEIKNSDEIILELTAEDVTALSWEYDETKLAFHKGETWLYDDDEAFPVNEEKINDLLGLFESFGVSFIIENVEDYSQYGLDNPTCSIHIETAEESYEVELGGYSTMDEQVRSCGPRTLLELTLDTGRTHQIRVHMAYLGCPLTGDFLYGRSNPALIARPALHSAGLELVHPITGERLSFAAPLPADLAALISEENIL